MKSSAVTLDDLSGEVQQICNSLAARLYGGPEFEVLLPVVEFVSVEVVDGLAGKKGSTKHLLHDVTMLENPSGCPDLIRETDASIPIAGDVLPLGLSERTLATWTASSWSHIDLSATGSTLVVGLASFSDCGLEIAVFLNTDH